MRKPSWIEDSIQRYGWAVQGVGASQRTPPFAYTIGLQDKDQPELLVIGLRQEVMHPLLNDAGTLLVQGQLPLSIDVPDLLARYPVRVLAVDPQKQGHWTTAADAYARRKGRPLLGPPPVLLS